MAKPISTRAAGRGVLEGARRSRRALAADAAQRRGARCRRRRSPLASCLSSAGVDGARRVACARGRRATRVGRLRGLRVGGDLLVRQVRRDALRARFDRHGHGADHVRALARLLLRTSVLAGTGGCGARVASARSASARDDGGRPRRSGRAAAGGRLTAAAARARDDEEPPRPRGDRDHDHRRRQRSSPAAAASRPAAAFFTESAAPRSSDGVGDLARRLFAARQRALAHRGRASRRRPAFDAAPAARAESRLLRQLCLAVRAANLTPYAGEIVACCGTI